MTSSKWLSVSSAGDSIVIFIRWERLLLFRLLRNRVLINFILEKLLSTNAVETGIERLIVAILHKFGNSVLIMSLETSSFNCDFMLFSGLFTNSWRYVFHSVVMSEVMTASLFVGSPSNVSVDCHLVIITYYYNCFQTTKKIISKSLRMHQKQSQRVQKLKFPGGACPQTPLGYMCLRTCTQGFAPPSFS